MIYSEEGFRSLYMKFGAYMLTEPFASVVESFPRADKANCVLTMGYVDHTCGFTLEVLALGVKNKSAFKFFDAPADIRAIVRIEQAADLQFFLIDDKNGRRRMHYSDKISALASYEKPEGISVSRKMMFLDRCRDPIYVDDVQVRFLKNGLQPENMRVRISDMDKNSICDNLLNEPNQDFGIHKYDEISFNAHQTESGKVICVCII